VAVITISRLYGSGGDEIADLICQATGYHHFSKGLITQAAVEAGFSEDEITSYSDFSEVNYKYKTFLDRLLRRMHPAAQKHHAGENAVATLQAEEKLFNEASALTLVQSAVKKAYEIGNIVIIGRAGQIILKNYPGVLNIRIEAPLEDRIRRIESRFESDRGKYGYEYNFRQFAGDLIAERDAGSADYVRLFYNADWADRSLYHAVFNTGKMSLPDTAKVIVNMAETMFT
jgi:CMP/dCMP kinase